MLDKNGNKVSDEDIRLLRRLETDLIFAYLTTMATQPGSANHFGRSHMVEKSYWENYGQWHPDFCNLGLAGDVESEAYRLYEGVDDLHAGLDAWDEMVYKHQVPLPANDFMRNENSFSIFWASMIRAMLLVVTAAPALILIKLIKIRKSSITNLPSSA